ncbi:hypothetical protein [Raineyella fluvialis]|uniref:Uncharacterized protein n=1 Tax=Raineyella fluvialis TaxID=2662261 RepID=A0A5Q2F9L2_9ACTN|nr:hypothetical protein [Raineyella fluvialis]QGF23378.1 hypothetical protein Rai3103_06555 [Raineyella fluvialis]
MESRRHLVPRESSRHGSSFEVPSQTVAARTTSAHVMKNREQRRSAELLEAIAQIDTITDPVTQAELAGWIQERYEERGGGTLIGLFGHCYLGHPYVDHRMDVAGNITQHFKMADAVPGPFAAARPLARSSAYLFIEIYDDGQVVPVRPDGSSAI